MLAHVGPGVVPDAAVVNLATNAVTFFAVAYLTWVTFAAAKRRRPAQTATLVVLGDIGRSPRMMDHAESLLDHGFKVQIIGYANTSLPSRWQKDANLTVLEMEPFLAKSSKLPRRLFILFAPFKAVANALLLLWILFTAQPSRYTMVQNPPSIPTLPVVQLWCLLSGSKLIIDWHNTGASILSMRLGPSSVLVKAADKLEGLLGQRAYLHLFVTHLMRDALASKWRLRGKLAVFYDRPPAHFRALTASEKAELFARLPQLAPPPGTPLAVSSTSWTADEDFSVLLDALRWYEEKAQTKIWIVVTGKGPLRAAHEAAFAKASKEWKLVQVRFAWLEAADYPLLLGAADFGVSLHASSSGFDLPMKVVDMFGAGLPVVALEFPALKELVQHGVNGLTFDGASSRALASCLEQMADPTQRATLAEQIASTTYGDGQRWRNWKEAWDEVVWPAFQS